MAQDSDNMHNRRQLGERSTSLSVGADVGGRAEEQLGRDRGKGGRVAILGAISVFVLFIVMVIPTVSTNPIEVGMSLGEYIDQLVSNVRDTFAVLANTGSGGFYGNIVFSYMAAFVAGASLGGCGAVLQGSFRNPLASPSTLGVISGCLLGAVLYVLTLDPESLQVSGQTISEIAQARANIPLLDQLWSTYGRPVCAIAGGLVVVLTALLVSRVMGGGSMTNIVLVVIGQVFSLVITSVCDTIRYYFEATGDFERGDLVQYAQAVPFNGFHDYADLVPLFVPVAVMLAILLLTSTKINALTLSDEEAWSLGVDVSRFRTAVILLCAMIIGIVVGWCGPIAFVGFVSPHVARRIVGSDFRYLLPASLFVGAMFLCIVLFVVIALNLDTYQGINLIASSVGCVAFIIVAFRGRGRIHAWR